MFKNKYLVSMLGFAGAILVLLFALNWAFHSLAPKTIPDAGKTPCLGYLPHPPRFLRQNKP